MSSSSSRPLTGVHVAIYGSSVGTDIAALLLVELGASVAFDKASSSPSQLQSYVAEIAPGSVLFGVPADVSPGVVIHHHSHCSLAGECSLDRFDPTPRCDVVAVEEELTDRPVLGLGREVDALSGLMYAAHSYKDGVPVFNPLEITGAGTALLVVLGAQLAYIMGQRTHDAPTRTQVSELKGALLFMAMSAILREDGADLADERVRDPQRAAGPTLRCFRTSDGWVLFAAPSSTAWAAAAIAMERTDLLADPRYEDVPWGITPAADAELVAEIESTMLTSPTDHWIKVFREAGVPVSPVLDVASFRQTEHLRVSGAVAGETDHPGVSFWKFEQRQPDRPIPTAIRGDAAAGPLAGLKVVEVATYAAAPAAAATLADFGATVVKLEQPPSGDPYREQGLAFSYVTRGKQVRQLDLAKPEGAAEFHRLIADADVVILNNRLSSVRKLGLDFESLSRINPRLVYCWVTGWGSGGPLENEAGVDPMFQAASGMVYLSGGNSGSVRLIPSGGLDMIGCMLAVDGILAALIERERSGAAQYVEASLARSAMLVVLKHFLGIGAEIGDLGRDPTGFNALDRIYQASDGWLYLKVHDEQGWQIVSELLERDSGTAPLDYAEASVQGHESDLASQLSDLVGSRTVRAWEERLGGDPHRVSVTPVNTVAELRSRAMSVDSNLFVRRIDELWGSVVHLSAFASWASAAVPANQP